MPRGLFTYGGDDLFDLGPVEVRHGITYKAAFLHAPPSVPDFYNQCFSEFAGSEFVVDGARRLTYRDVQRRSDALGAALQSDFGVKKGDRVAIAMANSAEWIIGFIAATAIGTQHCAA